MQEAIRPDLGDDFLRNSFVASPEQFAPSASTSPAAFSSSGLSETDALSPGLNFNEFPNDYVEGLTLFNDRWAIKFGGYMKADLIHDFRAIESRDTFDPVTIPVGAQQYQSSRFHARQTRLNMDVRWNNPQGETLRMLIEGDFFGEGDTLRLRHAYGEYNNWLIGQTWTTFTHRAALPNTLDVVGDVASVGRRQAQVRWTRDLLENGLSVAAAVEDSTVSVDDTLAPLGTPRTRLPDFVGRIRFTGDNAQFQMAALVRQIGFEPTGQSAITKIGAGLNVTSYVDVTDRTRTYGGIVWGDGIGNYRNLPDIALTSPTTGDTLESTAWYVGVTHYWNKSLFSNFTFSEGLLRNTPGQDPSAVNRLQYLAANLILQPTEHTFVGVEGLWGERQNFDMAQQDASRIMMSFGFLLP